MSFEDTIRQIIREELASLRDEIRATIVKPVPSPGDRVLKVKEAAELARVEACTVYEWISRGLKATRPPGGRVYTILESDLREFMRRGTRGDDLDDLAAKLVRSLDG